MPDRSQSSASSVGAAAEMPVSKYERLIAAAKRVPSAKAVVVHPCDETSLRGAAEAAHAGLISPILVGPEVKIRHVAREQKIDIAKFELADAAHSDAAAAKAVELVRAGQGEMLMKGSLHTDELMREVTASNTGLRTERRISHVFVMDVPTYAERCLSPMRRSTSFPTWTPNATLFRTRLICSRRSDSVRRGLPFSLPLKLSRRRCRRLSKRRRSARWPTAGRLPALFSMGRLLSITQSTRKPRGSRAFSRQSPAGRKSWSCPISRPAICWQKISSIWRKRIRPVLFLAHGCQSYSPRGRTRCEAAWPHVRLPCFMLRPAALRLPSRLPDAPCSPFLS
jgi:hypothetical protein